jgi:hypothetical protein
MLILARLALALFLAAVPFPAFALDNPPAAATQALVPFASDEGLARLARSNARVDFPMLANQYEEELDATFCGPASAAMVLNAVNARSGNLPKDMSRLHLDDLKYCLPASTQSFRATRKTTSWSKARRRARRSSGSP